MTTPALTAPMLPGLRPDDIEVKAAAVTNGVGGGAAPTKDPYVFDIVASVTGIADEVNDIIVPGAYAKTLANRTPKVIKDHDWAQRIGKVLEVFEAMPGDPRLPKTTARGAPWPKNAGALMAKVRLLAGTKGGDEAAVRWREYGSEQEFSIGYAVPKGTARREGKNRILPEINLFELSDVLFGAMPLAGVVAPSLATKMIAGVAELGVDPDDDLSAMGGAGPDAEGEWVRSPAEALSDLTGKSLTTLGLTDLARYEVKYDTSPIGTPGGRQNWVDKAGGLPKFIRAIAHALIREGKTDSQAIQIAIGVCKNWAAGGGDVKADTRAKAAAAIAEWEKMKASAKADNATDEGKAHPSWARSAPTDDVLDVEGKAYPHLPGTVEERMEALRGALDEAFRGGVLNPDPAPDQPVPASGVRREWDYISIVGTWADRVVFTRARWSDDTRESWEVPYTIDGGDGSTDPVVTLGDPVEVRLEVTAVPHGGEGTDPGADPGADDGTTAGEPADPTGAPAGAPEQGEAYTTAALHLAELLGKAADLAVLTMPTPGTALEGKAGRVLSGNNATRLRAAVETLLQVLRDAGVEISTDTGVKDRTDTDHADGTMPDSTAPSAQRAGKNHPAAGRPVELDPADYARAMAILADVEA